MEKLDAVVVGGGLAGLAASVAVAKAGLGWLPDRAAPWQDNSHIAAGCLDGVVTPASHPGRHLFRCNPQRQWGVRFRGGHYNVQNEPFIYDIEGWPV